MAGLVLIRAQAIAAAGAIVAGALAIIVVHVVVGGAINVGCHDTGRIKFNCRQQLILTPSGCSLFCLIGWHQMVAGNALHYSIQYSSGALPTVGLIVAVGDSTVACCVAVPRELPVSPMLPLVCCQACC